MERRVLEFKHPVDGEIIISIRDSIALLACRWPFDLSTDEYISITNEYAIDDLRRAVHLATEGGSSKIFGVQGGFLEIRPLFESFYLDFSNIGKGFMYKSLEVKIDNSVRDSFLWAADAEIRLAI